MATFTEFDFRKRLCSMLVSGYNPPIYTPPDMTSYEVKQGSTGYWEVHHKHGGIVFTLPMGATAAMAPFALAAYDVGYRMGLELGKQQKMTELRAALGV